MVSVAGTRDSFFVCGFLWTEEENIRRSLLEHLYNLPKSSCFPWPFVITLQLLTSFCSRATAKKSLIANQLPNYAVWILFQEEV